MTKVRTLQIYRGTTAQNDAYTGSAGELTMDTTLNEIRIHDGSTAGGHIIGSGGGSLPSQTGHAGEFLTTDGTDASWAEITDYIVEKQDPTAGNNYTWYRKYKSGWVEQGGVSTNSSGTASVTIPVEMSDTNYTVSIGDGVYVYANADIRVRYVQSKTTTGFTTSSASGISFSWQVSGMAA